MFNTQVHVVKQALIVTCQYSAAPNKRNLDFYFNTRIKKNRFQMHFTAA